MNPKSYVGWRSYAKLAEAANLIAAMYRHAFPTTVIRKLHVGWINMKLATSSESYRTWIVNWAPKESCKSNENLGKERNSYRHAHPETQWDQQ